jgi:PKD repeat protein
MKHTLGIALTLVLLSAPAWPATTYDVGPDQPTYKTIASVPWATLQPGDTVLIHAAPTPYYEKWVICRQGTAGAPIVVRGIPDTNGNLPIIDGNGAVTPAGLNFWGEERGVIKIGGANTPADTTPAYITIENLDIRSGRPPFSFTGDDGASHAYVNNCASMYIEKGQHIVLRNCIFHDSGNGLFIGISNGVTQDILVEGCYIYDNGTAGSIYEHNSYTAAVGIVFQYNRYGPLRTGCDGNNLKDRSVGQTVRYNWIESGNRQLDLVDCEDDPTLSSNPLYHTTYVYGNVLVEPDGAGNSQIVHYGGDSGNTAIYRKGTLHFYHNTVISTRAGNTTLFRLSTNEESADCRNNIVYVTAAGSALAMVDGTGVLDLRNNWFKTGWVNTHGTLTGAVNNISGNITGSDPGFVNAPGQDFRLASGSPCIGQGAALASAVLPANDVLRQYVKHRASETRPVVSPRSIGAFEFPPPNSAPQITSGPTAAPNPANVGQSVAFSVAVSDADNDPLTYTWDFKDGSPAGSGASPAHTYSATGTYAVTVTVSDGQGHTTAPATVSVTINPAGTNSGPQITSAPGATPNPATAGQSVAFSVAASDADNDPLTYTWDFKDGSPAGSGAAPTHTFAVAGTYAVTVVVSDDHSHSTAPATVTVTVNTSGGGGGGGGGNLTPGDADSDGFSDEIEVALQSDPHNGAGTPFGLPTPQAAGEPPILKMQVRLNFAKPDGADGIMLSGTVPVAADFIALNKAAILDVGGVVKDFTLDKKGKSTPRSNDSFKLSFKSRKGVVAAQTGKFIAKFNRGTFAATLADDGLTDADFKDQPVSVFVTMILDGKRYEQTVPLIYKARHERSGRAKK